MTQAQEPLQAEERKALADTSELSSDGGSICIARRSKSAPALEPGTKCRLLLLDDDPDFVQVMERALRLAGYDVRSATNREAGSRELRAATMPHVILLDVGLGDMNGFEVLLRLRRHPRLGSVPVIMLTGHTTRKDVVRGLLRGADGYVSKPCRLFALNHAIRTVLGLD